MAEVAIPIALAGIGGGLSAVSSIMAGKEQAAASKFEAQQLDLQAKQYKTTAAQAETQRREDLSSSLQTIMALRAGRGVSEASPTGMAIYDHLIKTEERNISTEKLNYLQGADTARMQAIFSRRRAKSSLLAGYLGAGQAIATTGAKMASMAA